MIFYFFLISLNNFLEIRNDTTRSRTIGHDLSAVHPQRRAVLAHQRPFGFHYHKRPRGVFVLNGYAGTGKTSIMGAMVKAMRSANIPTVILAPTGRAAKVAASLSDDRASTIHKRIFRGNSADPSNTTFFLAENRDANTSFIVDEASLITDSGLSARHSFSSSPGMYTALPEAP